MSGVDGKDNCSKFVDILGLRSIFPLFMKTPKQKKRLVTANEHEGSQLFTFYNIFCYLFYKYFRTRCINYI